MSPPHVFDLSSVYGALMLALSAGLLVELIAFPRTRRWTTWAVAQSAIAVSTTLLLSLVLITARPDVLNTGLFVDVVAASLGTGAVVTAIGALARVGQEWRATGPVRGALRGASTLATAGVVLWLLERSHTLAHWSTTT